MTDQQKPTAKIISFFGHAPGDNSGLADMAGAQPLFDAEGWKNEIPVIVTYLATAIVIGWTEGTRLTLADCIAAMPEIQGFVTEAEWERALTVASMAAFLTNLAIPERAS